MKDTFQRLSAGSLTSLQNLAPLDQNDWVARITVPRPNCVEHSTGAAQRHAGASHRPARQGTGGSLRGATRAPLPLAGDEGDHIIVWRSKIGNGQFPFRQCQPELENGQPRSLYRDEQINDYPAHADCDENSERLLRISPHYTSVEAPNGGVFLTQSIYFTGLKTFLSKMTESLGSVNLASTAFARRVIYANALHAFGRYHLALNGINFGAMALRPHPTPPPRPTIHT